MRWIAMRSIAVVGVLASSLAWTARAHACGGCFQPAGEVSVLSAHRMALSIAAGETVLWDQVQYTGNPEEFVWVLPVAGEPTVELADAGFFEALSRETALELTAPPVLCPCCGGASSDGTVSPRSVEAGPLAVGMPVDPDAVSTAVLYRAVVGPYETVTVRSPSADAIVDWLVSNGYRVPETQRPMLAHYAGLGMSFVVLRLRPDVGVDQMQPVRIRTPGVSLSLPLRMVAAGAGDTIELELFVVAEGRMEAASFGNAQVDRAALSYDATAGRFDYDELFEDALFAGSGATTNWVTETAAPLPSEMLASYESIGPDGNRHSAEDDVAVAVAGLSGPYLTRLRTRLQRSDLELELTLRASSGGDLGTSLSGVTVNVPACPGSPSSPDAAVTARPERHRSCSAAGVGTEPAPIAVALLALVGLRRRSRAAARPAPTRRRMPRERGKRCPPRHIALADPGVVVHVARPGAIWERSRTAHATRGGSARGRRAMR